MSKAKTIESATMALPRLTRENFQLKSALLAERDHVDDSARTVNFLKRRVEWLEWLLTRIGKMGGNECEKCYRTGLDLEYLFRTYPDADRTEIIGRAEDAGEELGLCTDPTCWKGFDLGIDKG